MDSLDIALKGIKAVFIYNMLRVFQSRMVFGKNCKYLGYAIK